MKIGNLEKVPNSDQVTKSAIYEVLVTFDASWKGLVLLFEQNGHLVSWHFKDKADQWKFQLLEIREQQQIHHQLLDQELLKKVK